MGVEEQDGAWKQDREGIRIWMGMEMGLGMGMERGSGEDTGGDGRRIGTGMTKWLVHMGGRFERSKNSNTPMDQ